MNRTNYIRQTVQTGVLFYLGALITAGMAADSVNATLDSQVATNSAVRKIVEYRIQPMDALQISVFNEPDLSMKVRVSSQGVINYPLLGSVEVNGLTLPELEKKLTTLLGQGYLVHPSVTVGVENMSRRRVVVLGQVKSPGALEIAPDESLTVMQAIGRTGGFTDFAARDRVTIIRSGNGKEEKITVNVAAIMKGGNSAKDVELKPDDVLSVPLAMF